MDEHWGKVIPDHSLDNNSRKQVSQCEASLEVINQSPKDMRHTKTVGLLAAICCGLHSLVNPAVGQIWTPATNAPSKQWWAVASSADGSKLVAVIYGGRIYTSTNSAATWFSNSVPTKNWYSVASSADGTKLAAVTFGSGAQIWSSTNGGATWNLTGAPTGSLQNYISIASSSDGTKLVAAGASLPTRHIYISTDSGETWATTSAPNLSWYSVASSSNGTKLVALPWNHDAIYTSTDSGTNWTPNTVPSESWYSVSSSADGNTLVAVVDGGGIYTSTNSGTSWTSNSVPNQPWRSVASSADGTKWVAVGFGAIYTSTDSGQTWVSNSVPAYAWASVASSADGSRLVAVAASGQIYTAQPPPPRLSLTLSGSYVEVTWPSSVTGFKLQENVSLATTNWTGVIDAVSTTNGLNQMTVSPTNSKTFYRLGGQ